MTPAYTYRATVLRVIDADTFRVGIDLGFHAAFDTTIRLINFDAYETRLIRGTTPQQKAWGIQAKEFCASIFAQGHPVHIATHQKGKYGRWLATLFIDAPAHKSVDLAVALHHMGYDRNTHWTPDHPDCVCEQQQYARIFTI